MPVNNFSVFKNAKIEVGFWRRAKSGFRDKTTKKKTFDNMVQVSGVVSSSSTVAVALGATGAFATVASGPGAALILGGIALYQSYGEVKKGDREPAHEAVRSHMWSMIDDIRPKHRLPKNNENFRKALYTLIYEAQEQHDLRFDKLKKAEAKFDGWWLEYLKGSTQTENYPRGKPRDKKSMEKVVEEYEDWIAPMLAEAGKSNGPVWEYMRRLIHFGNYMQVFAAYGKILAGVDELDDFGKEVHVVDRTRAKLKTISERMESHKDQYETEVWALENGLYN